MFDHRLIAYAVHNYDSESHHDVKVKRKHAAVNNAIPRPGVPERDRVPVDRREEGVEGGMWGGASPPTGGCAHWGLCPLPEKMFCVLKSKMQGFMHFYCKTNY